MKKPIIVVLFILFFCMCSALCISTLVEFIFTVNGTYKQYTYSNLIGRDILVFIVALIAAIFSIKKAIKLENE